MELSHDAWTALIILWTVAWLALLLSSDCCAVNHQYGYRCKSHHFPKWWTKRHHAIVTLFFPVTYILSVPFWLFIVLRLICRHTYKLWILATTIEGK